MAQRLHHARRCRAPLVYVNACGATDELIFDGRSFVTDAVGEVTALLADFEEEVRVADVEAVEPIAISSDPLRKLHAALVLGIREFASQNGIRCAFLVLSGGADSAVVVHLAVEALDAGRVTGIAMPSRYSDERSTTAARELATGLGAAYEVVPIEGLHRAADVAVEPLLGTGEGDTTAENLQARLRMLILMAFVNRHRGMLLNTSNKTELALGYSTLYGDMAGTLCPIADLTKIEVVELARWLGYIPEFILERPPTAELRPDQVDPFDYPVVAPAMEKLVRCNRSNAALRRSEHKRWQMGVILKVSEKAFGTGRLIPITRR